MKTTPIVAVTGSQRPYIYDLPHLLSLPHGFEFRFRYRQKWVESELQKTIAEPENKLIGREVLILFHSESRGKLIPIRRGRVIGIESVGPMIFLRIEAGEFVRLNVNLNCFPETMENLNLTTIAINQVEVSFSNILNETSNLDLTLPLPHGKYLWEARSNLPRDSWNETDDWTTSWAKVIAILQSEKSLKGIPFFFLQGFINNENKKVILRQTEDQNNTLQQSSYKLIESHFYTMRIVQWCEPNDSSALPAVKINCEFNKQYLSLEGSRNVVLGRYDVIEFSFRVLEYGLTEISLRAEPFKNESSSGNNLWESWPAIYVARVPIKIVLNWRQLLLPIISFVLGGYLYIYLSQDVDERYKKYVEIGGMFFIYFSYQTLTKFLEPMLKIKSIIKNLTGSTK